MKALNRPALSTPVTLLVTVILGAAAPVGIEAAPRKRSDERSKALLSPAPDAIDTKNRSRVGVMVDGEVIPWDEMAIFAVPGERVGISVPKSAAPYELVAKEGVVTPAGVNRWTWQAPRTPSMIDIDLRPAPDGTSSDRVRLHAFVMVPLERTRGGLLNGYRIGVYPARPLGGKAIYRPPRGLIEVTKDNADTRVSPHFRLRQFLSKQEADFPKYVVLRTTLLLKLEGVLEKLRATGVTVGTLHIMSGYRTPFYNENIGNVAYSQHLWGSAADVFVDDDDNQMMDDLNGDKVIDRQDAEVLKGVVQQVERESKQFVGGLGAYAGTRTHGPFVHLDVRGTPARW